MTEPAPMWLLACGHTIAMLEYKRSDDLPRRPRMCPICGKPRDVVDDPDTR